MLGHPEPREKTSSTSSRSADMLGAASQEWEEHHRELVPYQITLRGVGAYLDQHHAQRASVLELIDGFSVSYYGSPADSEMVAVHVAYQDLLTLDAEVERKRQRKPSLFGRKAEPGSYKDVFRALGYELEVAKAYSLLIDQTDDGLLVTYQYLNPSQGSMVRKRMAILSSESIEQVVRDARSRRAGGGILGIRNLLAG
jgi:hypothetical protein